MATYWRNTITANITSITTVYNPTTANQNQAIAGFLIANTTNNNVNATATLTSGSTTVNIVKGVLIPPNTTIQIIDTDRMYIKTNDVVSVSATGAVDVTVSSVEIS